MDSPAERSLPDRSEPERGDRRRLQQVQQQDLTESRVNEDFLFWLKNKGPNYLFVLLLCLCAVMAWNLWQRKKTEARTTAWADLGAATLPVALEEVAATHKGVDAVSAFALLSAADRYMSSILDGARFDRQASDIDFKLTPELREQWLADADRLYGQTIAAATSSRAGKEKDGFVIAGHFGRAAVAESRGEIEAARTQLTAAATAAETNWAPLARIARQRIESLDTVAVPTVLPTRAELPSAQPPNALIAPVVDDQLIRDLLTPSSPATIPTPGTPGTPGAVPSAPAGALPAAAPTVPPAPVKQPG